MSIKIKVCADCRYHAATNLCTHPEQADIVTGEPTDCYMNRDMAPPGDLPHCGPSGELWEASPSSPT